MEVPMKKQMFLLVLATIGVACLSITQLSAQEWTKDQQEVWNEVEKMWSNWESGNIDAAFVNVHDKYIGWNNTSPLPISKSKWVEPAKKDKDKYTNKGYDIEPARILVEGDAAVVHYYYTMWWIYDNGEKKENGISKGKWSEFFIKEGGKWKLIGDFTYEEPQK
jgi:hypothetical protein